MYDFRLPAFRYSNNRKRIIKKDLSKAIDNYLKLWYYKTMTRNDTKSCKTNLFARSRNGKPLQYVTCKPALK